MKRYAGQKYYDKVKRDVFRSYGDACECCGEKRPQFLSIDHTNGGGVKHRSEVVKARNIYRWLREQNYPKDGFRILCFNCNLGKGLVGFCHPELAQEA